MERVSLKMYFKIIFISVLSFFAVSCTSAEIKNFFDEIANYEAIPENASNPQEFYDKLLKSLKERDMDEPISIYEYKKMEENYIRNKKTGTIVIKDDEGGIYERRKYVKGNLVESIEYYKDGIILGKMTYLTNGNEKLVLYYPNRQIAAISETTYSGSKNYTYVKAYYEDGKPAIIYQNGKGKMYRKDGRVKFELINGLGYYKTIS